MNLPVDINKITTIATDLDGTALDEFHDMQPLTAKVLDALVDKGYRVLMATGRPYSDVVHIATKFCKNRISLVTSNGAMLDHCEPCPQFKSLFPRKIVEDIINYKLPEGIIINIFTDTQWFASEVDENLIKFFKDDHFSCELLDLESLDFDKIVKFYFADKNCSMNPDNVSEPLNNLFIELETKYQDQLQLCFSLVNCLEVNTKGITKLHTIEKYMNYFGDTARENLICFGDGLNDYQMLNEAKYGFIMENADIRLKDSLARNNNTTVICKNSDFGVARTLNQLFNLGFDLEPVFTD